MRRRWPLSRIWGARGAFQAGRESGGSDQATCCGGGEAPSGGRWTAAASGGATAPGPAAAAVVTSPLSPPATAAAEGELPSTTPTEAHSAAVGVSSEGVAASSSSHDADPPPVLPSGTAPEAQQQHPVGVVGGGGEAGEGRKRKREGEEADASPVARPERADAFDAAWEGVGELLAENSEEVACEWFDAEMTQLVSGPFVASASARAARHQRMVELVREKDERQAAHEKLKERALAARLALEKAIEDARGVVRARTELTLPPS